MGEDTTLEAFLGAEKQSEATTTVEEGTERGTDAANESDGSSNRLGAGDDVEPATTTFAFAPSKESCDACGDTVERRWQQDGALVCADCKDW